MPRRSSSSGNFSRKLQPAKRALKRLASKLHSKINELDFPRAIRVIRNGTNRIMNYCSTHLFRNNRSRSLQVAKTASYRHHSHHNYISDYYNSSSNRNLLQKSFSAIFIDQLYAGDDPDAPGPASTSDADGHRHSISKTAPTAVAAAVAKTTTTTNRAEAMASVRGKEVVVSNSNTNTNSVGGYSKRPPVPRNSCREGAAVGTRPSLVQRRKKEALAIMEEMDNDNNNPMETLEDAWREVVARSPQLQPVDVRAEKFIHSFRADMKIQKAKSILEYQNLLDRR